MGEDPPTLPLTPGEANFLVFDRNKVEVLREHYSTPFEEHLVREIRLASRLKTTHSTWSAPIIDGMHDPEAAIAQYKAEMEERRQREEIDKIRGMSLGEWEAHLNSQMAWTDQDTESQGISTPRLVEYIPPFSFIFLTWVLIVLLVKVLGG